MKPKWRKTIFYGRWLKYAQWRKQFKGNYIGLIYFNNRSFQGVLQMPIWTGRYRSKSDYQFESADLAKQWVENRFKKIVSL